MSARLGESDGLKACQVARDVRSLTLIADLRASRSACDAVLEMVISETVFRGSRSGGTFTPHATRPHRET